MMEHRFLTRQDTTEEELIVGTAPSSKGYQNFVLIGAIVTAVSGFAFYLTYLT